jgi:methionyl-tRNA synthetase
MDKQFKRTTVTSALPYANGGVHIGHLAGVYVPADIYVRYLRLKGREVLFIGGSDEHGVPVTQRARKEGITPQDVVDRYHKMIKDSFEEFGISFDIYSRTTSETHHKFAAEWFRKLYDEGKLVEQTSKQFFDEKTGKFLTDRDVVGTCPYCGGAPCARIEGKPCRHPSKVRPSLEAFGFDMGKTAQDLLGLEIKWSHDEFLPEYLTLICGIFY